MCIDIAYTRTDKHIDICVDTHLGRVTIEAIAPRVFAPRVDIELAAAADERLGVGDRKKAHERARDVLVESVEETRELWPDRL